MTTAPVNSLKARLDKMIAVLKDCQDAFDNDNTGLKGYIGGQPINEVWQQLYKGDLSAYDKVRGWVPFYCEHKVMAGLRDAAVYAGDDTAKTLYRKALRLGRERRCQGDHAADAERA